MAELEATWIIGAGHSGSTLLGMMLGAHSRVFYAGEAKKSVFLGDPTKPKRKRECKLCGPTCKVWGELDGINADALYRRLRERTGAALIVDSTKNLTWVQARVSESRGALVFLTRDGRAVVNSRLRKYPELSIETQVNDWLTQVSACEAFFEAFEGPKIRVAYEDLAQQPEATLRAIAATLGIEYDDDMLRFEESEQHPLGGNNGTQSLLVNAATSPEVGSRHGDYYRDHPGGVVLDLRWRQEMKPDALDVFNAIVGVNNADYAFDEKMESSS
ncbi:MAG: sulfotransferase [Polyangiales bacterium]